MDNCLHNKNIVLKRYVHQWECKTKVLTYALQKSWWYVIWTNLGLLGSVCKNVPNPRSLTWVFTLPIIVLFQYWQLTVLCKWVTIETWTQTKWCRTPVWRVLCSVIMCCFGQLSIWVGLAHSECVPPACQTRSKFDSIMRHLAVSLTMCCWSDLLGVYVYLNFELIVVNADTEPLFHSFVVETKLNMAEIQMQLAWCLMYTAARASEKIVNTVSTLGCPLANT